jgi:hypothetical protein
MAHPRKPQVHVYEQPDRPSERTYDREDLRYALKYGHPNSVTNAVRRGTIPPPDIQYSERTRRWSGPLFRQIIGARDPD